MDTVSNLKSLVLDIHRTPHKAVLAITGGGSEAIGELLRYGGGSATVLEAVVPYDTVAFARYVGGKPDKFCSPEAARDLAMASFRRAVGLGFDDGQCVGVGATCSLAKEGERLGRTHHAHVAVQTSTSTLTYVGVLGDGRELQERQVAECIIRSLGHACGVCLFPPATDSVGSPEEQSLVAGRSESATYDLATGEYHPTDSGGRVIFPGSFNPWHAVHARIAEAAFRRTGKAVDLEVSIGNVDKSPLNFTAIHSRLAGLTTLAATPWIGKVILTNLPTFAEKAAVFPASTFVLGWDTFQRLSDPRYGDVQEKYLTLQQQAARFLVFHRVVDGASSADGPGEIHPGMASLATVMSPEEFAPEQCSSTQIRKELG